MTEIRRRVKADIVRRLRSEMLLTQQELADAAKVSRQTIIAYERGYDSPPKADCIRRVAEALSADPRDLVEITL